MTDERAHALAAKRKRMLAGLSTQDFIRRARWFDRMHGIRMHGITSAWPNGYTLLGKRVQAIDCCEYPVIVGAGICCMSIPCAVRWRRPCDAEGGCWDRSTCGNCAEPVYPGDPGYEDLT